jgi:hypothetical protein
MAEPYAHQRSKEGSRRTPRADDQDEMSPQPHPSRAAPAVYRGVMSPPPPNGSVPGLMAMSARPGAGFMRPDPSRPALEWSRDGVSFLWLVALVLGVVVWIALLAHGADQR